MTHTSTAPGTLGLAPVTSSHAPSRLWAYAGVAAGLLGTVGMQASLGVDAVYDERFAGDPQRIMDRLEECVPSILTFHTTTMLATVLLLVFGAGLRRRLRQQAPADSLLPDVALGGTFLTAVAGLLGAGFTTEMVFGVTNDDSKLTPEMAVVFAHWIGTIPWLWVGAGVTGIAVAVAALRHAAAPRWIGWVAALLGGVTLLAGLSPLQYMAGFSGPVLVLVAAAGFAFGDRAAHAGR
ncbi:hypothetical protein [Nocardioides caldifontis]|uniref:hypothetical protein n=1 Tax=Nocardioides caldifontis TaxID=2588938 RepID=UPI00193950E0|nr:hypothetical protein [Nocardioides caldifontis]